MTKLSIWGYQNDPLEGNAGSPDERFEVPINPEKFTFTRSLRMNTRSNGNNRSNAQQVQGAQSATLSFDLIFDDTGIAYSGGKSVENLLKELQTTCYKYEGESHKQLYLKVFWKNFHFYCHLQRMNVECSLFKPDGTVIRAKASLSFTEHKNNQRDAAESWNRSPDLTQVKTVRVGDTLLQMCKDIYKDPNYFIQIAELNNLINFRELPPGLQLEFPPLEK